MQQFRSQPGPDSLASNFSSLGFGDSGSQLTKSPHKATAESVQQVGQAPVQPQEMSSFSEQSSAIFPPYGSQVSASSSAVPSQGFQNQQATPQNQQAQQSQPSQQVQAQQVQAQQSHGTDVYDSSAKVATAESQDAYGMGMGGDSSGSRTDAQQQAYNRSVYAGSNNTAGQAGASGTTKPAAAGGQQQNLQQQGGEAMMAPNMQQQLQQQQQLSWQQQQQQQQSMMHWGNTAAYGWTPQVFQQMMYMGYPNSMAMYPNYQQQQANPMAGAGHSKQGFNAQSNKKQNQNQQQQQYGTTPGYGAGYGAGSNFPGYMAGGDASTTNQDYYKSQAAAGGAYGGMYPMFNGMPMDSMAGYGMGQQGAGGQGAASGGSMRGYGSAMGGAGAGAAGMGGMPGMDAHMMQYGNPSYLQGGGLDEQKNSWGQQ